jgi:hypothetical protein
VPLRSPAGTGLILRAQSALCGGLVILAAMDPDDQRAVLVVLAQLAKSKRRRGVRRREQLIRAFVDAGGDPGELDRLLGLARVGWVEIEPRLMPALHLAGECLRHIPFFAPHILPRYLTRN